MNPALLLLLAVLGGVLAWELRPEPQGEALAPERARTGAPAVVAAPARSGQEQAWVETVLARPLFSPDRRPAAQGAAPLAAAAGLPRVAGILVDGRRRSVIFASSGAERPLVIGEGGEVNGYKVESIGAGEVTVLGPDGSRVVRPSFDPNPPAQRAGAPAGQAPNLEALTGIPGLPSLRVPAR